MVLGPEVTQYHFFQKHLCRFLAYQERYPTALGPLGFSLVWRPPHGLMFIDCLLNKHETQWPQCFSPIQRPAQRLKSIALLFILRREPCGGFEFFLSNPCPLGHGFLPNMVATPWLQVHRGFAQHPKALGLQGTSLELFKIPYGLRALGC